MIRRANISFKTSFIGGSSFPFLPQADILCCRAVLLMLRFTGWNPVVDNCTINMSVKSLSASRQ